jgi:hypothetical protein
MAALPASGVQVVLLGLARILLIPAYAAILGATVLLHAVTGGRLTGTAASLVAVIELCIAFLPFVVADWVLRRQLKKRRADAESSLSGHETLSL